MEVALIAFMIITILLVALMIIALRNLPKNWRADMDSLPDPAKLARAEDLPPDLVYDVRVLMEAGRKIDAVRRVREVTRWGLKEAKAYVESLQVLTGQASYLSETSYARASRSSMIQGNIPEEALGEVQDLLARHEKIAAIKRVREVTNWGLKEAKDYVDAMVAAGGVAPAGRPYGSLSHVPIDQREIPAEAMRQVQDLLARRQKIEAIKVVREVTNWGLKEAKDFVDGLAVSK